MTSRFRFMDEKGFFI